MEHGSDPGEVARRCLLRRTIQEEGGVKTEIEERRTTRESIKELIVILEKAAVLDSEIKDSIKN